MKKIILAVVLLCVSATAHPATCKGLIGTWEATYTIWIDQFTNTFTITGVGAGGLITGTHFYNSPIKGYCKNGVVSITEEYSDIVSYAYYFVNTPKGFGRFMFTTSLLHDFDTSWHPAKIVKTSSLANSKAQLNGNQIDEKFRKLQLIEEIKQQQIEQNQ